MEGLDFSPHRVARGVMVLDSRRGDGEQSKHKSAKGCAPKHALHGRARSNRLGVAAYSSIATIFTAHGGIWLGFSSASVTS